MVLRDITEDRIGALVDSFYTRVRDDAEIGPIFNAVVSDWPHHLATLKDFWSTVLLTSGRYKGDPAMRHLGLHLDPAHFDRWLALFAETASETFAPESAAWIISKARSIGRNLQEAAAFAQSKPSQSRPDPSNI